MYLRISNRFGQVPSLKPASAAPSLPALPRVLTYSTRDVIDPRISVPAQHSLVRLSKNRSTNAAAVGMLEEIKAGRLAGIYCVNWKKAAERALRFGKSWWTVIPPSEDAVLMLDPDDLFGRPPLIAFRRELDPRRKDGCGPLPNEKPFPPSPARLDASLLKAWSSYRLWQTQQIVRCGEQPSPAIPMINIVPPGLCRTTSVTERPTIVVTLRRVNNPTKTFGSQLRGLSESTCKGTVQVQMKPDTVILRPNESGSAIAIADPSCIPDGYFWEIVDQRHIVTDVSRLKPCATKIPGTKPGTEIPGVLEKPFVPKGSDGSTAFFLPCNEGSAVIHVTPRFKNVSIKPQFGKALVVVHRGRIDLDVLRRLHENIRFEAGDRDWAQLDLADLRLALSRLSEDELRVLDGYTFRRVRSLQTSISGKQDCGIHDCLRNKLRIEIADQCFKHPTLSEGGAPIKDVPTGTFKILHEIGHAMECSVVRSTGKGTCGPGGANSIIAEFKRNDNSNVFLTDDTRADPAERFAELFAVFKSKSRDLEPGHANLLRWFRANRHFRRANRYLHPC